MEDFGESDRVHGRLAMLLRQVDHSGPECHLDFDERFVAVGEQVFRFAGIDADDAEKEVARGAEGHLHFRLEDAVDRFLDVRLEDVGFGQFFVPMSRQPDAGQGALFGQHKMCVEHGDGALAGTGRLLVYLEYEGNEERWIQTIIVLARKLWWSKFGYLRLRIDVF